jgi:hypothetical protein
MLEEMATVGDESIVSWQPHGKAFRVHLPDAFASTVMKRYFKQTKFKSFQRQLQVYGFVRINKGMDAGAYFHSMFIRNNKSMSLRICCQKTKGSKESSNAFHYDYASCGRDFYSSETTNVDNNQYQDTRRSLVTAVQSNPILACTATKEKKRGCGEHGPATVFTAGSSDHHPDEEEEKPLLNNAFLFDYQEVAGGPPSPTRQFSGSEMGLVDLMLEQHQAQTIVGDEQGFFAGNTFYMVETKALLI